MIMTDLNGIHMDLSGKVYSKTGKGAQALSSKSKALSSDNLKILASIDGKTDAETLMEQFQKLPDEAFITMLTQLEQDGYIRFIKNKDWEFEEVAGASHAMVVDELSAEDYFALASQPLTESTPPIALEHASAVPEATDVIHSAASASEAAKRPEPHHTDAEQSRQEADKLAKVETKARQKAERIAKEEADRLAREAEEKRSRAEAESAAKAARLAAERLQQEEEQARQKMEAEARTKAENEARLEAERLAREEEARKQAEIEMRAKAAQEAKMEAERKAQEQAARRAREEAERQAKQLEQRRLKAEAQARTKAEKQAKSAAARIAKEEARHQAEQEKALRQKAKQEARADAAELAQARAAQKTREKAERQAEMEAQRALRPSLDWSKSLAVAKKGLIYSPLVVLLLIGLLHVVNLRMLIEPIEARLAELVGEPVSIREVRISLFPNASLILSGITIGAGADTDIGHIRVSPMVLVQSNEDMNIRRLEIEDVTVTGSSVASQMRWLAAAASQKNKLSVEEILIKAITLSIPGLELSPWTASVIVPISGGLDLIVLESADQRMKVDLVPTSEGYQLTLNANAWQPPASRLQFTELHAEGFADGEKIHFDLIEGQIYSGTVSGDLTLIWASPSKAFGNFVLNELSLPVAFSSIESFVSIEGMLSAKGTFSSEHALVGKLMEAIDLNATFTALRGKINGVNLSSQMISAGAHDKATRFDQLTGTVQVKQGYYQYRQLLLDNGQFKARGNFDVLPSQDIVGKVSGELVTPSRAIRNSLSLSGKVGNVKVN
jgi:actin-related protein